MATRVITVSVPLRLSDDFQNEVDIFFQSLCRRLASLNEEEQRQLIAELNHYVTFYDPEHLIRP